MKLQQRMQRSIKQRAGNVVLRSEVAGLGSSSQVSAALKALQNAGVLVRIGTGVYAKPRKKADFRDCPGLKLENQVEI